MWLYRITIARFGNDDHFFREITCKGVVEDTREINYRGGTRVSINAVDGNNTYAYNMAWRTTFRKFVQSLHDEMLHLKRASHRAAEELTVVK